MSLKRTLNNLVSVIAAEADKNSDFRIQIERVLGLDIQSQSAVRRPEGRRAGRRTPALLDPVATVRQGESILRTQLASLNLEQLRDVVAQYGMDPGKLVMKWKDPARVIERIVEVSITRSTKGDAFRKD